MARRRWQVRPDYAIETQDGPLGVVSRQALVEAIIDGATMLDRAGGVFTVIVGRQATDLAGEMVTTGAIFEWKDRTDAKPQAEQTTVVTEPVPLQLVDDEPDVDESDLPPALRTG